MLLTFAVSGFVSFALEIIWFRMLVVLFRPTTYAFTVMLGTVLAGIAIGSWLSTPVTSRRRSNLVGVLAALELLLALAAVVSMWLIGRAGDVFAWAGPLFTGTALAYFGPMAVTSIAAIFPAALLMGMAFPVGISLWVSDAGDEHAGRRIGVIYAVNVVGAVAGSLLTGFLLLPAIGGRESLLLTSVLALGMGLLLLTQISRRFIGVAVGAVAVAAFGLVAWRTPDPIVELLRSRYPNEFPLWREEDGHASVAILERRSRIRRPDQGALHQRHPPGERQPDDGELPPADRHAADGDPFRPATRARHRRRRGRHRRRGRGLQRPHSRRRRRAVLGGGGCGQAVQRHQPEPAHAPQRAVEGR